MTTVDVLILHPTPPAGAGEIERWVGAVRASLAAVHRAGFLAAGATEATVLAGPPDGRPFGARLAGYIADRRPDGIVVLGSGAIPLASVADRRSFVAAAAGTGRTALANSRFSADIIAISEAVALPPIADLASDNALPRRLAEAGFAVADLARRSRLGFDVDGPLEVLLLGRRRWIPAITAGWAAPVEARLAAVRAVARDAQAELLITGRASASGLAWLERSTASRTRALIEERGFRTRPAAGQRPVRSVLGRLLARDGPAALGAIVAELADGALIDSRVLIADRFGADEAGWPVAEDRFASDLLLADRIADPWLQALTRAACDAPVPIVLGGHSLVGPGLPLALGGRSQAWT